MMVPVEMVVHCYDILLAELDGQSVPPFDIDGFDNLECPMFVTWEKKRENHFHLRGCIGTLSPAPIEDLWKYTHSSAFRDRRFEPIRKSELPLLRCAVSLLCHYEVATNYKDWQVGLHGTSIEFQDRRGKIYRATYLPEVAKEQGWNQEQALESLIHKAGYRGRVNSELLQSLQLTRYQSSKLILTYDEYLAFKGKA